MKEEGGIKNIFIFLLNSEGVNRIVVRMYSPNYGVGLLIRQSIDKYQKIKLHNHYWEEFREHFTLKKSQRGGRNDSFEIREDYGKGGEKKERKRER